MYGLIGKLKTRPGQRQLLIDNLLKAAEIMRAMEGCHVYIISEATDDPDTIWISEVWRSKDDHGASLANEGIRGIIMSGRELIAEPPDGFEVTPVGGVGLPGSFD